MIGEVANGETIGWRGAGSPCRAVAARALIANEVSSRIIVQTNDEWQG